MTDNVPPEIEALARGLRRATGHFIKAGMELLAAVEAVLDELNAVSAVPGDEDDDPVERIPVE